MLRLTIIIPACGSQEDLDNTLVSVLENRPPQCEVIVPHATSYHDPYDLSDEVRFVPVPCKGLVELVNAGIDASQSPIIHVLQSGIEATPDWTTAVIERFAADVSLAAVAPRIHQAAGAVLQDSCGVQYRRGGAKRHVRVSGDHIGQAADQSAMLGPGLHAAFYRRSALMSIGRFDSQLGAYYCDVDAMVKLRRSGWRCGREALSQLRGALPQEPAGFRAARAAERLFWRHAAALGAIGSCLSHPWLVAGGLARQFPRPAMLSAIGGRMFGLLECVALRRHRWQPQVHDADRTDAGEHPTPTTIPLEEARRRLQQRPHVPPAGRGSRRMG